MAIPDILSQSFLVPKVAHQFDPSGAVRDLVGMPRAVGLIAQHETSSQVAANEWKQVTTPAQSQALFGKGSQADQMWQAAYRNATKGLPIHVCLAAVDNTATAATATVTYAISGTTATTAFEAVVWVGGKRYGATVPVGATVVVVANTLAAKINADAYRVVNATVSAAGVLTLTARWPGATGNLIDVRTAYYDSDTLPSDISATIVAMNGGVGAANISQVIAAMNGLRFTELATAFTDQNALRLFAAELQQRWSPLSAMDCQLAYTIRGTEGEIVSALTANNSHQMHTIATTKDLTNPWETSAAAAAAIESSSMLDPAVPYTGIQLKGYLGSSDAEQFTEDQKNVLLTAGASPLDISRGAGYLSRMVTNHTTLDSNAAIIDPSARNLNWVKTLSYYRWFTVWTFSSRYRGYKLAEYLQEPISGQKIMTAELGQEIMLNIYDQFCAKALMQHPEHYKSTLLVEVEGRIGKLKILDEPLLVTQHYQTEVTSAYIAGSLN